ncbi:hypothetical protein [Almyronema epifaneia]|uniref:MarR family transcriptional regulator n=1 Tax=Almyronema epifaneia S1 TaxID=2991925 RepID=A0ABW6IE69_9CYAN
MSWPFEQIRAWLSKKRADVIEQDDLGPLPAAIAHQIDQKLQASGIHPTYRHHLLTVLDQHLAAWQADNPTANSLAILHSPVEALTPILQHTLQHWPAAANYRLHFLPLEVRPNQTDDISQLLETARSQILTELSLQPSSDRPSIVIIPRLDVYFLRCIGGWQAIEQLRDMVTADLSRFWLIGCNGWAWTYFDIVCQIEAYLEQTTQLPELDGEQIQNWLQPLLKSLDGPIHHATKRTQSTESSSPAEKAAALYADLANISHGISSVAVQLWWRSLGYELNTPEQDEATSPAPPAEADIAKLFQVGHLKQQRPSYPEMPNLSAIEDYLIYSVLLHGSVTVAQLAISLGELEGQVRAQVQKLLRQGILRNQDGMITVAPAYYPKLHDRLRQNNFVIGGDR